MIYHHTQCHMISSTGLLVLTIKPKDHHVDV